MKAFTRERLLKIQQWRETYGPGSNVVLPAEEAEELARIALASLETEPVAIVEPSDYVTAAQLVGEEPRSKAVRPLFEGALSVGQKLYAAPRLDNPFCPKCGGTGLADSGGTHPWGEPIYIECDCRSLPPAPVSMKDHQIRELVNELRDIAVEYHGTQQLRERIARTVRAAMLQGKPAGNSPVIPDGYVVVPKCLTAENGAKGLLVGEFSETKFINCPECFGDDECETCDGSGRIEITVTVSWTNIKAIWAKGVEHFAAPPQQEMQCE